MKKYKSIIATVLIMAFILSFYTAFADGAYRVFKIEVEKYPDRMEYIYGLDSSFSSKGLKIKVYATNGEIFTVDSGFEVTVQDDSTKEDYGKITVEYGGKTTSFFVNFIENPVSSIEYIGEPIVLYDKGSSYEFDYSAKQFKVNFKDGSSKQVSARDIVTHNHKLNVDVSYNWKLGNNYIYVNFGDVRLSVLVKVIKNTLKKLVIERAPECVYYFGDNATDIGPHEIFTVGTQYDYEQLKFTVYHTDGRKETFYGHNIDYNNQKLGNVRCTITSQDPANSYIRAGTYPVTLTYGTVSDTFTMTLKTSPVKSVELIKGPDKKTVKDRFSPDFFGTQFKINYKNGEVKYVTVNKDTVSYRGGITNVRVWIDSAKTDYATVKSYELNGVTYFQISYFDKRCSFTDMITYDYTEYYKDIEIENASTDLVGMTLRLIRQDGSVKKVKLTHDAIKNNTRKGLAQKEHTELYTYTDDGIIRVNFRIGYDENGVPVSLWTGSLLGIAEHKYEFKDTKLRSVSVLDAPKKIRYKVGEKLELTGLCLTLDYGDGALANAYYGDEGIEVTDVDMSTLGKKTVKVTYKGFETSFEIEVTDGFSDVKNGAWYYNNVNYAYEYGLFDGTDSEKMLFSPEQNITRAQFVKALANYAGVDTSNNNISSGFKDVPKGKWYTGAVKWAVDNRITAGFGNGIFKPDEQITREQMCVMFVSFVEKYMQTKLGKIVEVVDFKDFNQISSWAKKAVVRCAYSGLISGLGDGNFGPKQVATRAQAATIFTILQKEAPFERR